MGKAALKSAVSIIAITAGLMAVACPANAASREELEKQVELLKKQIAAQQEQLDVLTSQIRDVKTSSANQYSDTQRQVAESPKLTIKDGRPTFTSGDGKFSASLRGRLQFDYASYLQDAGGPFATDPRRGSFGDATEAVRARDLNSGTNFRRAQIGLEGKILDDWTYSLIYEFGGSGQEDVGRVQDLYIQYNGIDPLHVRVGAFAPYAGYDDTISSADSLFLERASSSDLSRQVAGADGRTGVALFGNGEQWFASLSFTGAAINTQSFDEQAAVVGRVAGLVYKSADLNIHLGANATYLLSPPGTGPDTTGARHPFRLRDRPEIRVDGTRLIDTGNINTETLFIQGVEAAANFHNFYIQGEHFWYQFERDQLPTGPTLGDPEFSGWYVQAAFALTGEERVWNPASGVFGTIKPNKPFDIDGSGWGAWELAARYSVADLNWNAGSGGPVPTGGIRGGEQTTITAGLNWYVNNNIRFLLDYQWIEVDRLSTGAANAYGTGIPVPAAGTQVGQDLEVVSIRSQLSF